MNNYLTKTIFEDPIEEDLALISRAKQNDLDAFSVLVTRYQEAVYRQAYWLLGEPEAAEDAAQEAFCRAYLKINTFNGESFRAWVLRITSNYCIDQMRRHALHTVLPFYVSCGQEEDDCDNECWLPDESPLPEELLERSELSAAICQMMLKLAPKYRLPVILVDVQELNYEEAATVLNLKLGTFKSRLSRGRAKLAAGMRDKKMFNVAFA